jgi:hypothetical protein
MKVTLSDGRVANMRFDSHGVVGYVTTQVTFTAEDATLLRRAHMLMTRQQFSAMLAQFEARFLENRTGGRK